MDDGNNDSQNDGGNNEPQREPCVEVIKALLVTGASITIVGIKENGEVCEMIAGAHKLAARLPDGLATGRGP